MRIRGMKKLNMNNSFSAKSQRDYFRYLRIIRNHLDEISLHLIYTRIVLTKFSMLGVPFILKLDKGEFYQIDFFPDGGNYCRRILNNSNQIGDNEIIKCMFPSQTIGELEKYVSFFWEDYAIVFEMWLDRIFFSNEPLWIGLMFICFFSLITRR